MFIVKPDFLKDKDDYVLLDCRYIMNEPDEGHKIYEKFHIKGAHYVDLDRDLVGKIGVHGGRHPLKDLDEIKAKLESLGVDDDKEVFIYDSGEMPMASVLWFVLQLIGKDSYVIEGGFDALVNSGFHVTTDIPDIKMGKITSPKRLYMRADINDVIQSMEDDNVILVDVRSNSRYLGLEEPYDKIAGHIPGAVNIFWKDLMNSNALKNREELERIFSVLDGYDEVIFQCGSGITGAVALIIYMSLGKKARLYSGSYSDYISYQGNKLIVKDNKEIEC
ncbi:MAG: sulfurtransferase [Clostridiales bacterium]|nr:MAG: sulfurtransferase [Clostridiales bacterium]